MVSEKTWKRIRRAEIVIGLLASIFIIVDILTEKIGFAVPVFQFLWKILNQRIPVFIVIALGLAALIMIRQTGWKLTEKEAYIISLLDEEEIGLGLLFKAYKRMFPAESRTMSNCIIAIQRLEKRKIVKSAFLTGGANIVQDEVFKLSEKGLKRYKRLDAVIKEKGKAILSEVTEQISGDEEESRIEPHEEAKPEELNLGKEHTLILGLLGMVKGDIQDESLYKAYIARNPKKDRLHFKFVIDDLKQKGLIEICLNVIGDNSYLLSAKGLAFLRKIIGTIKEEDPKAEM